jgi:two-component system LytT family response regulator
MDALRVLIVEDEVIARRGLQRALAALPGITVVGECGDGHAAVAAVRSLRPDLVLLDVQMPGLDGFEVIEAVGVDRMPPVVFVTAYQEPALRAFDVHAVDYLLKPVDPEKLARAVQRARQRTAPASAVVAQLSAVLADVRPRPRYAERLPVKSGGRVRFVRVVDVEWMSAADNYVELHVGDETHLVNETLGGIEERLDPERFVRVHRSRIVNVDRVRELRPMSHGEYEIVLESGARVSSARRYRERLRRLLGEG